MAFEDGKFSYFELLVQKLKSYHYDEKYYIKNLVESIIPAGLKIKKNLVFFKWKSIIYYPEKNII